MSDTNAIVQDQMTGLFGFRLEMGRAHDGTVCRYAGLGSPPRRRR